MNVLRQAVLGALAAVLSTAIVFGSLAVSLMEGGLPIAQAPVVTASPTSTPSPLPPADTPLPGEPTFTPSPSPEPTLTPTVPPPAAVCTATPADWTIYIVQNGDTLPGLAQAYGITPEALKAANCLEIDTLPPGSYLYVPGATPTQTLAPTATDTQQPPPAETADTVEECGPPPGWVRYTVRPGDTLSQLSRATGASLSQIRQANCLGSSSLIRAGQVLYLPQLPPTSVPTSSSAPTATRTPRPTDTLPPSSTLPPTLAPTATPRFTRTPQPTSTFTQPPTDAPTATPPPTATDTVTPTTVPSPTSPPPIPTDTDTPVPTAADTPTTISSTEAPNQPVSSEEPSAAPEPEDESSSPTP